MKHIPNLKYLSLAITLLKIQLLAEFRSDLEPPRALTLQVNKAASIKTWFSKAPCQICRGEEVIDHIVQTSTNPTCPEYIYSNISLTN